MTVVPKPPDLTGLIWWVIARIATAKYNASHIEKKVLLQRAQPDEEGAFPPNQRKEMADNYLRAAGLLPDVEEGHLDFGPLSVGFSNRTAVWPDDFPNYDDNRTRPFEGQGPVYK